MDVIFLRQAYKFVRKSSLILRETIKGEVLKIRNNPQIGRLLVGSKLKNIRSYKFVFNQVSYRIAYFVEEKIIIIAIASRENFYRDLARQS